MKARTFQKGASLLTALFLIVTIAALGAVAVQIGSTQRQTANFTALGDRAFAAAQSGIEWGAYRALTLNACVAVSNIALGEDALNGFTVRITCNRQAANDCAPLTYDLFDITAFAQRGVFGTPEYVSRSTGKRFGIPPPGC